MKKNSISGWKDVYRFSFFQTIKNKAFIITTILLFIIALVSMPIINIVKFGGSIDGSKPLPIKTVYVKNETSLAGLDFNHTLEDPTLSHISFVTATEEIEDLNKIVDQENSSSIIMLLEESVTSYDITFIKPTKGDIKEKHVKKLGEAVNEVFNQLKLQLLDVSHAQVDLLNAKVDSSFSYVNENGETIIEKDTSISNAEYWFVYGLLFAIMMVNITASTQIATSIVTEKSTRVVEYLLTSVRPLALMVGKILASLSVVLLQMASLILLVFASNKISQQFTSGASALSQLLPQGIFSNINPVNIVLSVITIALGFIFYAGLAGMAGATVSKLEEINEGLTLFTMVNLVGVYIGLAAANVLMVAGTNGFTLFSFIFPLSSAFILPGAIFTGKVTILMVLGAIALQIVFIILLYRFVAKVYETLILHTGNKIKVKELFQISKR